MSTHDIPADLAYTAEPLASLAGKAGVRAVADPIASDAFSQFMPWRTAVRFALAHREWPLWNPFELGGGPATFAGVPTGRQTNNVSGKRYEFTRS